MDCKTGSPGYYGLLVFYQNPVNWKKVITKIQ